jgi:hypothetical protein
VPGAADVHRVVGERVVAGDVAGLVVGRHHVAPRRVERRGRAVERDHALVRVDRAHGLVDDAVAQGDVEAAVGGPVEEAPGVGADAPRAVGLAREVLAARDGLPAGVVDRAVGVGGDLVERGGQHRAARLAELPHVAGLAVAVVGAEGVAAVEAHVVEAHRGDHPVAVGVARDHQVAEELHPHLARRRRVARVITRRPSIWLIQRPSKVT